MSLNTIGHPGAETPLRDASFSETVTNPAPSALLTGLKDPSLQQGLTQVRSLMLASVSDAAPFIRQNLEAMIEAGGKMLRPALVLIAGRYRGAESKKLYTLGAALEMLHTATLVHDDILDDAATRRGRPALHATVGAKAAVLIGDYLFARCFSLMDEAIEDREGLSAARVVERICEGEINQSRERYSLEGGMRAYRRRICAKTAALIAASLTLGAREGGCSDLDVQRFRRIGYDLGMGFQVIDDLLDFDGTGAETGKPVARDLADGVFTAPVIHALASPRGDKLRSLLKKTPYSHETLMRAVALIRDAGGVASARRTATAYTAHAEAEIAALDEGWSKRVLADLARDLLTRRG